MLDESRENIGKKIPTDLPPEDITAKRGSLTSSAGKVTVLLWEEQFRTTIWYK